MKALLRQVEGLTDPAAKTAAVERYLAARGANPVVEQNSRLVFFVRDDGTGRTPRIVGDFNAWAMTPQGYDARPARRPHRGHALVVPRRHGVHQRPTRIHVPLRERGHDRPAQSSHGAHVHRPALRDPHAVLHQPSRGGRTATGAGGSRERGDGLSRALKGARRVWTYVPAGYDASQDLYPTVYFLDGGNYADWMAVPSVLDRLIAAKRIPPVIAVFVEPGSRQEEYSRNPAWRAFVATELVPHRQPVAHLSRAGPARDLRQLARRLRRARPGR